MPQFERPPPQSQEYHLLVQGDFHVPPPQPALPSVSEASIRLSLPPSYDDAVALAPSAPPVSS